MLILYICSMLAGDDYILIHMQIIIYRLLFEHNNLSYYLNLLDDLLLFLLKMKKQSFYCSLSLFLLVELFDHHLSEMVRDEMLIR
jgi:hypothetical protein